MCGVIDYSKVSFTTHPILFHFMSYHIKGHMKNGNLQFYTVFLSVSSQGSSDGLRALRTSPSFNGHQINYLL